MKLRFKILEFVAWSWSVLAEAYTDNMFCCNLAVWFIMNSNGTLTDNISSYKTVLDFSIYNQIIPICSNKNKKKN